MTVVSGGGDGQAQADEEGLDTGEPVDVGEKMVVDIDPWTSWTGHHKRR